MRRRATLIGVASVLFLLPQPGCREQSPPQTPRVIYGTTPVTALAPSHTIPYPTGPSRTLPYPTGPRPTKLAPTQGKDELPPRPANFPPDAQNPSGPNGRDDAPR